MPQHLIRRPRVIDPLELGEEPRINRNILDLPHAAVHTKLVLLQQVAELIAVDQVDGGAPSRVDSRLASEVKVPVVISRPLSPRPLIAPRKSRTAPEPTLPM
jgi:hypothetical protein